MRNEESKRREGVRCRKLLLLAALAGVGLLAAPFVMAADPVPATTCSPLTGWTVQAPDGLTYKPCTTTVGAPLCTFVTYKVSNTSGATPDHMGTFIRKEAGPALVVAPLNASVTYTDPCGADSVIGIGPNADCHERIVRINNQPTKSSTFTLRVDGKRLPLETSVVVRKGNSQGACTIVGFGLEDTSGNCVHACGDFDPHQSIRKVEIFKFKGCEVKWEFDTTTGEVIPGSFEVISGGCSHLEGLVSDLKVQGGIISDPTILSFGDGWVGSGNDSCNTRLIAGRYYTVCY